MSAAADAVMSPIRGCHDAEHLVLALRDGCAPADALLACIREVQATNDAERIRSFCRVLQKVMERS